MLGAILEEPPFVDDTSSLGARAGGGANVLQRHEELVRACAALPPPPDPSDWFVVRPATEERKIAHVELDPSMASEVGPAAVPLA